MDPIALSRDLQGFGLDVLSRVAELSQPLVLLQAGLLLACFLIAHLTARKLEPALETRLRNLPEKRVSQLRIPLLFVRRLRPLIFILLAWLVVLVMRQMTWPSRSYYVSLIASLVSAWTFVAIVSRLIRNPLLRTMVKWAAWGFFIIAALGLTDKAGTILDSAALQIGEVRISLLLLFKAAVSLILMLTAASWIATLIARRVRTVEGMSPSMRVLTEKLARLVLIGLAIIIGLQSIGFDLTSITVLSGAIGLGLGFGLQKVVSNLVSGVILLLDKSIKPGDVISLGGTFGWISSLGARYVSVVTRDGKEYLIPNEDLITREVVNWSHTNDLVRLDIHFGVAYASDPHAVRKLAREAAASGDRVVREKPPVCHIVGFGDSSIDFVLRFWIHDPSNGITNIRGDVFLALWDALKANGIEIPFPRRDVTIVNAGPAATIDTVAD